MSITNDIRSKFIDFFVKNNHVHVPSASLVPQNDPTLMFTNSGMVQFKNIYTGAEKAPYPCATTYQKCVRAGGKHNDLDNVGYTLRHHTFFEMLGNFSFGDYFKEQAIAYAWEFLTKELEIPTDRMLATVYHSDDEAYNLWKKIAGFTDDRIIRINSNANFWQMGDTGPCGPCSEIFYDHGEKYWGGRPGTPEEDGDRFIEIWNLVFDQFEDLPDGRRIELGRKSIDTGAGLERLSALMHGTNDNFEIDIFKNLIEKTARLTGKDPYHENKASFRIIADHLRSSCFLIADGVFPSNEGRGYVLRRIMRRAMRHVYLIGYQGILMYQLVPFLIEEMGETYPELIRAQTLIVDLLKSEETKFRQMLERGLKLLDMESSSLKSGDKLSGDVAFKLYDTYGFPLDLTQESLRSQNIAVDVEGFESAMNRQREEARKAWAGSGDNATETVWFDEKEKNGGTEFLGYTLHEADAKVLAIIKDGKEISSLAQGKKGWVIFNQTPFYGEIGGQVGDTGEFHSSSCCGRISDTQRKLGDLFIHEAEIEKGVLTSSDDVTLRIDLKRREQIQRHHSATHLLQAALQQVLGAHVAQKGSYVTPDYFRFDFTHSKAMTAEELSKTERLVNEMILQNQDVHIRMMSQQEAIKTGAMALFGEKYGDEVRVVFMGESENCLSKELCGGTHVAHTGDIGFFKIISESAVSAGVRRIESKVGFSALNYAQENENMLKKISEFLRIPADEAFQKIQNLADSKKHLEKELSSLRQKLALVGEVAGNESVSFADSVETVHGISFIGRVFQNIPVKEMKGMVDSFKAKIKSGVVAIISTEEQKASVVIGVTDDLTGKINAIDLVRKASVVLGGQGGGGRPDMAQAGGSTPSKAQEALETVKASL
jgi:alanyl-tRNA synthetase